MVCLTVPSQIKLQTTSKRKIQLTSYYLLQAVYQVNIIRHSIIKYSTQIVVHNGLHEVHKNVDKIEIRQNIQVYRYKYY